MNRRKVYLLEFNNRQKSLLIQILSKEWEKARQNVIDIEDMINLIDDKKSKKVYFETIEKSFAIQAEKNYHEIMDNK